MTSVMDRGGASVAPCPRRPRWQRNASVLLWTPVLLLGPVLDVHGTPGSVAFQIALIAVIGGAAVVAGTLGGPPWRDVRPAVAVSAMAAATFAGATHHSGAWLATWLLLANALPAALRGRWLVGAVPAVAAASMWAAWVVEPHRGERVAVEGFVVLLAGVASAAFATLLDTVDELRRTRQELARVAVSEERERFSRDLHDLLGQTLSVVVVKAEAVRRLVGTDPGTAARHAADIEQIGRRALVDVRQAVDAMRAPSLAEELDSARRALGAAGISTTVDGAAAVADGSVDEVLAWVVREGATNVLRHSGASACRIEVVERDGEVVLSIVDDGVGLPTPPAWRSGGLDGLRDRLVAAGGELSVQSDGSGARLVATVRQGAS